MKRSTLNRGLLIAGVISLVLCSSSRSYAQAPVQDLNAAINFTRSEAYDKAEEIFKLLIQKEPGNSKNYFFYGENILQDFFSDTISNSLAVFTKEAKGIFDKGVSANPGDPLNYIGLARCAFFNKDNKTADEMRAKAKSFLMPYKNIKKMVPPAKDYAFTLAKLAESFITVDFKVDTAKALPFLREAIKIDSKSKDIFLIAGDIYNLRNDGSNAIRYYNLAQDNDPSSPTANMKIGSIYVRAKNLTEAVKYFEEAIKLNASYAPAYRELGALYASARRYDQSKANFEKYLELTKGNIPAKIKYVISLFYSGEYDEVITNVEEIFAVDKSKAFMNRLAGYSCYEKKNADYDKALSYMDALFETVSPELINKRDYIYTAKILLKRNANYSTLVRENDRLKTQLESDRKKYNGSTAAEKAKMKAGLDTLNARVTRNNKQIAAADKDIERAYAEYSKALTYDPEDVSLLTEIANSQYTYRRYDQAAKTWSKVIALGKNAPKDYLQLGRWYLNAEKFKSADSVFSQVIKMDPNNIDAYVFTARTYTRMEADPKTGLARPKFEKVLEKAAADSVKNADYIMEALQYLGYYHRENDNYSRSRDYYTRMINFDSDDKADRTKGYMGLGGLDTKQTEKEKSIEGRLPWLTKAKDSYNKILAYDANNESAKTMLKYVQSVEASLIKGINPNELKGTVKTASGQPVANASIRVKDTAAETYTNAQGAFRFEIPMASEALIISATGYKSKEVPVVRPLKPITVVLEQ